MENPTQEGASIHDRLMAKFEPPKDIETQDEIEPVEAEEEDTDITDEVESDEVETEASEPEDDESQDDDGQLALSDIAAVLGLDEEAFDVDDEGNVSLKTKIDGQEGKAKLKDVLASYQMRGHLDNKSREVSQLQEQLKQQKAELEQRDQQRAQEAEQVIQLAWQEMTNEFNAINWNELRQDDPAEFSAKRAEYQERQARLQSAYQQIQSQKAEHAKTYQQRINEHLEAENQKLIQTVKGWDNPEVAQKEFSETMGYMMNKYGFSQNDLYGTRDQQGNIVTPGITDHRVVVLAQKAMMYDKLQSSKPEVTKKVKTAPKVVKPGTPKSKADSDKGRLDKLKQHIKKSGGKNRSVAEYLLASGKV